jgi:tetraacyldisaccharide 4'-kinase
MVLSPGTSYGAELVGDEPLLISQRCPAATVFVGSDRVRLAERARDEAGAKIILLDDGMQHRRLNRDLEIAVIDQAAGFGNGRLLPRGPLREPVSALGRVDLLWINRAESDDLPPIAAAIPRIWAVHAVRSAVAPDGSLRPLSAFAAERPFVFAAVARPRALLQSWKRLGLHIQGARFFADHHLFRPRELEQIQAEARAAGASVLATTEKDRVRLPKDFPAWALRLEVKVVSGARTLLQSLGIESNPDDRG